MCTYYFGVDTVQWKLMFSVFIAVFVAVGSVVLHTRQVPVQSVDIVIYPDTLPREPLPSDAYCQWQDYRGEDVVYCQMERPGEEITVAYDLRTDRIVHTWYRLRQQYTVGQLVLSKGMPTWFKRDGY